MDDEPLWGDADDRIRAAFAADSDAARRIATRALTGTPFVQTRWPPRARTTVAVVVAAALLAVAVVWPARTRREPPAQPLTSLSIIGSGSLVVVDGNDGRRWIVGRPAQPPQGRYVIVIPQ